MLIYLKGYGLVFFYKDIYYFSVGEILLKFVFG